MAGDAHDAMPEVPSSPSKLTVTARLYQPLLSGPRSGRAYRRRGRVAPTMTETVIDPLPSETMQAPRAAVSLVIVTEPHTPPLHDTVTLLVCQAPQSAGPGEQLGWESEERLRG
jgi:hypothetical protein